MSADYKNIHQGLAARKFGPLNGSECSRGRCHTPDGKHYILLTDGMVIYSTTPHYDQPAPGSVTREWYADGFSFTELDEAMSGQIYPLVGRKVTSVEYTGRGDVGLRLTFHDGSVLEFAYSGDEGTTWLNGEEL